MRRWTPVLYSKKYFLFVYLIFHTLHKAFFSRESYTENQQMDDSAQKNNTFRRGKMSYFLNVVHLSTVWSLQHDSHPAQEQEGSFRQ